MSWGKRFPSPKLTGAGEQLDEVVGNDQELLGKLLETFSQTLDAEKLSSSMVSSSRCGLSFYSQHNCTDGSINWQSVVSPYNRMWFSHKNELTYRPMVQHRWTLRTWCWVREARHKRPHIRWSHWYEVSRTHKSIETESRRLVARGWGGGSGYWWVTVPFWDDENSLELDRNGAQLRECTKRHWIARFNLLNFMLCEFPLHLNRRYTPEGKECFLQCWVFQEWDWGSPATGPPDGSPDGGWPSFQSKPAGGK